jgi:hypothetical protein
MQVQLVRGPAARLQPMLRSSAIDADGPIATIPYDAIKAFLSRPGLMSSDELKNIPYVFSIRGNRALAGSDTDVYVRKLNGALNQRYNVMHIGQMLKDPDRGGKLGYMAIYAGEAKVIRPGDPATANVVTAAREVLRGDVLVAETQTESANIIPHAPARDVSGHIVGVVSGVNMVGQYQIVAINRGSSDGLEYGNVLRVHEDDKTARDTCVHVNESATCRKWKETRLPRENLGTMLVFKALPRMSYALILSETDPIVVGHSFGNR